jgi:hypothetical protein
MPGIRLTNVEGYQPILLHVVLKAGEQQLDSNLDARSSKDGIKIFCA